MKVSTKFFLAFLIVFFVAQNGTFAGNALPEILKEDEVSSSLIPKKHAPISKINFSEFAVVNMSPPQREMTGKEFKKYFEGVKFIKILNKQEKHYGFQYHNGLCELIQDFCPCGYQSGGLYFLNSIRKCKNNLAVQNSKQICA
ncbi:MAG: hypothetical protein AB8G05_22545 [Oligoflexales bacterium]